jgi:hypothetical protein
MLEEEEEQEGGRDVRSRPFVFSLDGYGEGEQASFAMAAWLGLIVVLSANIPRLYRSWTLKNIDSNSPHNTESVKKMLNLQTLDGVHLSNFQWASVWREFLVPLVNMAVHRPRAYLVQSPATVVFSRGILLHVVQGCVIVGVAVCSVQGAVVYIGLMSLATLTLSAVYTIVNAIWIAGFLNVFRAIT